MMMEVYVYVFAQETKMPSGTVSRLIADDHSLVIYFM